MEVFAPDFSYYWLGKATSESIAPATRAGDDETLPPPLKEALDALAERITAARSIV